MKKFLRSAACLILCAVLAVSFVGCSGSKAKSELLKGLTNEMTEENVIATVAAVESGLKAFDEEVFSSCVSSKTLETILSFSKNHGQFKQLGKDIFANLSMEVQSVDLEAETVTVSVNNKYLYIAASTFTSELLKDGKLKLVNKLDDEVFLNNSLAELEKKIDECQMQEEPTVVTLSITQGEDYLVLNFDDNAEAAVSGKALTAVKDLLN